MGLIQINVCVDKFLAYWADPAAPAALEYAERIVYLPLGMFGTAFMTVLLPTFSRQASCGEFTVLRDTLERAMRNLVILMAPCSVALVVLALPVIELIYNIKGGRFDYDSAVLCARALAAYAPGLLVFSFQKALIPAFYGMQDLRTPVRVSLVGLLLNMALNVASVMLLPYGWKHVGIAASTVVTSAVNGFMLAAVLRKRIGAPRTVVLLWPVAKAVFAAVMMGVAVFFTYALAYRWIGGGGHAVKLVQMLSMGVTVAVAITVYGALMALLSQRELREMAGDFRYRRTRKGV